MTPELLVTLIGLFVLVLCVGTWLAQLLGPDPFDEDRRHG